MMFGTALRNANFVKYNILPRKNRYFSNVERSCKIAKNQQKSDEKIMQNWHWKKTSKKCIPKVGPTIKKGVQKVWFFRCKKGSRFWRCLRSALREPSGSILDDFSSIFQHYLISIFTRFCLPTWSKNPSKIDRKSIPRAIWKTSNFLHRFFIDF